MSNEFIPVRRRWFVERVDYGRRWSIVPAEEDAEGRLRLLDLSPTVRIWNRDKEDFDIVPGVPMHGENTIHGCERFSSFSCRAEVQELMDALWEAGMRPSRP
jgi:hypothetical protein